MAIQCMKCGKVVRAVDEDENAAIVDIGWKCEACLLVELNAWPKQTRLAVDFQGTYLCSHARGKRMHEDAIKAFVSNLPGVVIDILLYRDGTYRLLSCNGLDVIHPDDNIGELCAQAYATGHAEGMADGLVLGADGPFDPDRTDCIWQLINQLVQSDPTSENVHYIAAALSSALKDLGVTW